MVCLVNGDLGGGRGWTAGPGEATQPDGLRHAQQRADRSPDVHACITVEPHGFPLALTRATAGAGPACRCGPAAAKCGMRRAVERCSDCAPGQPYPNHLACATQHYAALASEIGAASASFVRSQVDVRRPWPPFSGRTAAIATRLVEVLAGTEQRRAELARIAHWRAGLRWECLELPRIRDRPYEARDGGAALYRLPGALCIHFRTRAGSRPRRLEVPDVPWARPRDRRGR
jgi:hypothetical protein